MTRLNMLTAAEYVLNLYLFSSTIGFYICRKMCAYGKGKEKLRDFFSLENLIRIKYMLIN